jgi:hypothetical protein
MGKHAALLVIGNVGYRGLVKRSLSIFGALGRIFPKHLHPSLACFGALASLVKHETARESGACQVEPDLSVGRSP